MAGLVIKGGNKFRKALGINPNSALKKIVNDVSLNHINTTQKNIEERIYNKDPKPPKTKYKRTGRAKGGRIVKNINQLRQEIVEDTRLKGARKNYLPFLNKNTSSLLKKKAPEILKKFNSRYFDDAVKDSRKYAKEKMKTYFEYLIKIKSK